MTGTTERQGCLVPYCRRTRSTAGLESRSREWICATHWRLADPARRRNYNKLVRRALKRLSLEGQPRGEDRLQSLCATLDGAWRRLKLQVIERAMGIRA